MMLRLLWVQMVQERVFLKILNGILTPTSGCITWNNKKQFSDTLNTQAFVSKPILLRRSVR